MRAEHGIMVAGFSLVWVAKLVNPRGCLACRMLEEKPIDKIDKLRDRGKT